MGGDYAPKEVLKGVAKALQNKALHAEIILVGDKEKIEKNLHLLKIKSDKKIPQIIHAPEVIAMDDSPMQAVRSKKNSSIVVGLQHTKSTPQSAFFSAGHSGACYAASLMIFGRIPGVERAAIATIIPSQKGKFILLDSGANVDCRPNHLYDFAKMGATYAKIYLQVENPSVAILSNGEEDSKGTDLTRAAFELIKSKSDLNFKGYIEGKTMFKGGAHVVVTDGFTGNVVLKSLEGLGRALFSLLSDEIKSRITSKIGLIFMLPALNSLKNKLDYASIGSAPLLGVDGLCFIGHGSSNATAIMNGILRAQEGIELGLNTLLQKQFQNQKEKEE
jgi:glycerol-3-phosphate acyltransferase PlsX